MEPSARAPGYDLFKLVVALVLLFLFFYLFRRQVPQASIPQTAQPTSTRYPATGTLPSSALTSSPAAESAGSSTQAASRTSTAGRAASSTPTATNITQTSTDTLPPEPSATLRASPSPVSARSSPEASAGTASPVPPAAITNTPAATATPTSIFTPLPSLTVTPVPERTATPAAGAPSPADVCEAATSRSRLQVGANATILRRLNFRSSPGIRDNWLLTNIPGTKVEVIGGPECVPHLWGAYLWWQIRLPDGRTGWSAEGSLHGMFYFMEAVG